MIQKVFYGSKTKFNVFDITKTREFGYHFAADKLQSLHRISNKGYIYNVEIQYKNPIHLSDRFFWSYLELKDIVGDITNEVVKYAKNHFMNLSIAGNIILANKMNSLGYDAIEYKNCGESKGDAFIIWNKTQIKMLDIEDVNCNKCYKELHLLWKNKTLTFDSSYSY